jgi:hypothetical protein
MKNRVVTDGAPRTDTEGEARVCMKGAIILNVRALTDLDPLIVSTKHSAKPNARAQLYSYSANYDGSFRDIALVSWCHIWAFSKEAE